jgi:hypothetical protein
MSFLGFMRHIPKAEWQNSVLNQTSIQKTRNSLPPRMKKPGGARRPRRVSHDPGVVQQVTPLNALFGSSASNGPSPSTGDDSLQLISFGGTLNLPSIRAKPGGWQTEPRSTPYAML